MHSIFEPSPLSRRALGMLRIVAGLLFMSFGTMKLLGYPPSPTPLGPIELTSELGIAGMLETIGGFALVLGLLTRPVAFLLSGEMAVAYFQMHFPKSPFPTVNNGVPAVLFSFLFLYFSFAGAGAWSLDSLIARLRWEPQRTKQTPAFQDWRISPENRLGVSSHPRIR
jgi:putative oxidoreductase